MRVRVWTPCCRPPPGCEPVTRSWSWPAAPNRRAPRRGGSGRRPASADPVRYTRAPFTPPGFPDPGMGEAADALARTLGISRERQDQLRGPVARVDLPRSAGRLLRRGNRCGARDRARRSAAVGSGRGSADRLRPSFGADGSATAGNSCGISDGAAVVGVTTQAGGGGGRAALPADRRCGRRCRTAGPAGTRSGARRSRACCPGRPRSNAASGRRHRRGRDHRSLRLRGAGGGGRTRPGRGPGLRAGRSDRPRPPVGRFRHDPADPAGVRMLQADGPVLGLAACAIGGGQGLAMLLERPEC